ncbi:hypothetical protein HGRIS_007245 [Hohenbuehelia grisea]|uniref:Uncharacterized protein n=1 Tax=Hohenbuehelia grisea TaxID=104357 RepID=A0ABR3JBH7_9AGAR
MTSTVSLASVNGMKLEAQEVEDMLLEPACPPSTFYSLSAPVVTKHATFAVLNNEPDENKPSIAPDAQLRRSTRERWPTNKQLPEDSPPRKRKRALSTSAAQNSATAAAVSKKAKKDAKKKADTALTHKHREERDAAQKIWFYRHKDIFQPLLPSTTYFDQLRKDMSAGILQNASYVPMEELDAQPSLISGGQMKDYQLHGLSFLVWMYRNGMNCILGDEMGLGKTLQTLSLLAYIKERDHTPRPPHLIICPLSVLSSWEAEAARWVPSLRTVRFHGPATERNRLKESLKDADFDIVIATYESYSGDDGWFKARRWTYCVLDEGHRIKNSETDVSHKLQGLGSMHRLILTGTPMQNNLVELWSLLHWLYPNVFTQASERLFRDSFDITRGMYEVSVLTSARNLLSTIMLRRTKASVELSVPPRDEITVFLPMTEAQRFWTYRLLTKMDTPDLDEIFGPKTEENEQVDAGRQEVLKHLACQVAGGGKQWKMLMGLLIQLRQVCNHPYILPDAEPLPITQGEHLVAASSKFSAIDKLLADILPTGERVIIFSQYTGMLDLLEDFMNLRSISYARLDGSTPRPRRALDIKLFQQDRSPYQVYLISTKAGGLGINLTKATHVIMCDSDWNPQNDLQAIARAHRIGQTKAVKVYRLICRGSVEDQMLDRIRRKLFLSLKVMGSDNLTSSEGPSLRSSELLDILRKGSSVLASDGSACTGMDLTTFLKSDIADILEASRASERARVAKMRQELQSESESKPQLGEVKTEENSEQLVRDAEEEERRLLSGVAQVSCRMFDGKVIQKVKDNKDIAAEWSALEKRARVDRTIRLGGMTFLIEPPPIERATKVSKPAKQSKRAFEWEDWCNVCRDGGRLLLCNLCPRVFHAECQGLTAHDLSVTARIMCSQHSCSSCARNTAQCGGMLFKCRSCPQAFCDDCMPDGDIFAWGESIPEFEFLGYPAKSTSYYIKCHECLEHFKTHPEEGKAWEKEFELAEQRLRRSIHQ